MRRSSLVNAPARSLRLDISRVIIAAVLGGYILLYPRAVLADAIRPLLDPLSHTRTIAVSVMFAALLFVCYVTFVAAQRREEVA